MQDLRLILASQSERRKNILRQIGVNFHQDFALVDEQLLTGEKPMNFTLRLAETKAKAVLSRNRDAAIVAADTIVTVDDHILGKPQDREDAHRMLGLLSGRRHYVITALCLCEPFDNRCLCRAGMTEVHFAPLSEEEINAYLDTGEPMDKAGAYGIQERGALFIHEIHGCFFNVVGFPIRLFYEMWGILLPGIPIPTHGGSLIRR